MAIFANRFHHSSDPWARWGLPVKRATSIFPSRLGEVVAELHRLCGKLCLGRVTMPDGVLFVLRLLRAQAARLATGSAI